MSDNRDPSNDTNTGASVSTESTSTSTAKDVVFMQQFTAACVAQLKLLKGYADKAVADLSGTDKTGADKAVAYSKFSESVDKYVASLQDGSFDFQKILRKIYDVLKTEENTAMVVEKNQKLFDLRNSENKIISIVPGININLIYPMLSDEDRVYFWQYFHLMVLSTFNIFHLHNPKKISSQPHIMSMIKEIGGLLEKTGIMIDTKIFNPFLGLGAEQGEYGLNEMFAVTKELQTGDQITLEAVLGTLGVGNLINEKELNAKLEALKDSDLEVATDQIVSILGAGGNQNARNVCNKLVKNIVDELKINGIANVGNVLKSVAERSRSEIQINDMQQTIGYVQNFMSDGQEKLKNLKDENGNPIGQQVMSQLSTPLAMMKAMGFGKMQPDMANMANMANAAQPKVQPKAQPKVQPKTQPKAQPKPSKTQVKAQPK